jgi:hypothetical protein
VSSFAYKFTNVTFTAWITDSIKRGFVVFRTIVKMRDAVIDCHHYITITLHYHYMTLHYHYHYITLPQHIMTGESIINRNVNTSLENCSMAQFIPQILFKITLLKWHYSILSFRIQRKSNSI